MRKHIAIALVFLLAIPAWGESLESIFKDGCKLYQERQYEQAAEKFETLVDMNAQSSEVYYNLGVCYYRLNEIAPSILNFERAKKLAPFDEDVKFNLKVAQLRTVDKIEAAPRFFLSEFIDDVGDALTSDGWAVAGTAFVWLLAASLIIFLTAYVPSIKKLFFAIAIASALLATASFLYCAKEYAEFRARDAGIVFAPNVYVKSSPDDNGADLFILHEGAKVKLLDEIGDWKKIKIADGNVGWLPKKAVEII